MKKDYRKQNISVLNLTDEIRNMLIENKINTIGQLEDKTLTTFFNKYNFSIEQTNTIVNALKNYFKENENIKKL